MTLIAETLLSEVAFTERFLPPEPAAAYRVTLDVLPTRPDAAEALQGWLEQCGGDASGCFCEQLRRYLLAQLISNSDWDDVPLRFAITGIEQAAAPDDAV